MSETAPEARVQTEIAVLEKFGLRWAILAAWFHELQKQGIQLDPGVARKLEEARLKLSSGCISSCEIGCDLSEVEGTLVAREADSPVPSIEFWIELLGEAMGDTPNPEKILLYPPVRFHYVRCGFTPCRCDGSDR